MPMRLAVLAVPSSDETRFVLESFERERHTFRVAAAPRWADDRRRFEAAGADVAIDVIAQAGAGFAIRVCDVLQSLEQGPAPA